MARHLDEAAGVRLRAPQADRSGWLTSSRARLGTIGMVLALATAIVTALLTGPDAGPLTLALATFSGSSAELVQGLGSAIPLGLAFGAGMVAAVNPCGFALLPAY